MSIASPDPALLHDVLDGCARRVGVLGAQPTVATAGGRVELAWGETTPGRPMTTSTRSQVVSVAKVLTAVSCSTDTGGGWAGGVSFELPESDAELVPVGGRRFLPAHETNDERRLQEFWFADGRRPEHCYDGFVAARRVDASG